MSSSHRRSIVMGPKTWEQLKLWAAKEERSISDLIREAVADLLRKKDVKLRAGLQYDPVTDTLRPPPQI